MKKYAAIIILSLCMTSLAYGKAIIKNTPKNVIVSKSNGLIVNGLIGWYTFDGNKMLTAASDSSGQNNTGFLSGYTSTTTVEGKSGQALAFNGTNQSINTNSEFIGTTAGSFSAWIYPRSLGNGSVGRIISNSRTEFHLDSTNRVGLTGNADSNTAESANNGVILNTWNHVLATRTAAGTANIYINGTLSGTADQNSGSPVGGTSNVGIGIRLSSTNDQFDGYIDDVRIYNRVLTSAEVKQLYLSYQVTIKSSL